jgi:nucleotide-binding universal stress UspA family protein
MASGTFASHACAERTSCGMAFQGGPDMVERILLGFDDSDASGRAFDMAVTMTQAYKAQLYVLIVAQTLGIEDETESGAVVEHRWNCHRQLLRDLRDCIDHSGIKAHLGMLVGHPVQMILEHARQLQIDLIIIGHRGRGAHDRWGFGSVTHRIVNSAESAVLVVR